MRRAAAGDIDSVSRIARETFALACPPRTNPKDVEYHLQRELSPARFRASLADVRSALYVADYGGERVGYALIRDCDVDEDWGSPAGNVRQLYVRPAFHRKGVGRALMAAVFAAAVERRWDRIRLTVSKENARAVAFYEKEGFVIVGDTQFAVGSEVHEDFVMAVYIGRSDASRNATFGGAP